MLNLKIGLASVFFCSLIIAALGNTEIVNFHASYEKDVLVPHAADWPILSRRRNEGSWYRQPAPLHTTLKDVCELRKDWPCPHELWLVLDLTHEKWVRYSKFTLRLSWPAFFPTEFSIDIFDPEALSLKLSTLNGSRISRNSRDIFTRRKYARIRLVDTGVLTPIRNQRQDRQETSPPPPVPFKLILEPLYLGFIPASVLPTIIFLLPLTVLSSFAVPRVYAYLSVIAEKARRGMQPKNEGVKED